jgi:hypothetical protein
VEEAEFEAWFKEWKAACASMQHREEAMGKVAESIEQGLVVVGATAIEDKLQVSWEVEMNLTSGYQSCYLSQPRTTLNLVCSPHKRPGLT